MGMHECFALLFLLYHRSTPHHKGKTRLTKFVQQLLGPIVVTTPVGVKLDVLIASETDRKFFGNLPLTLIEAISSLKKGEYVLDIGANIGFYGFLAARQVGQDGRVFMFEPSPREFVRLLRGIHANEFRNTIPLDIALGNADGVTNLRIAHETHTGLNSVDPNCTEGKNAIVLQCRGDSILNLSRSTRIGLIKIDVEGLEAKVLEGLSGILRECHVRQVVVEVTPALLEFYGDSKAALYSFMDIHGFVPTLSEVEGLQQYDELFIPKNM